MPSEEVKGKKSQEKNQGKEESKKPYGEKETRTNPIHSLLILVSIYLLVQGIALHVGLDFVKKIATGEVPPAVKNPESPQSSGFIFIYILAMTGVILLLLKFKLGKMIKYFMYFAIFAGTSLTFRSFFPTWWLLFVILIYAFFLWKRKNPVVVNGILMLTIAGMGGYLGASLHFVPSLLLLLALSLYDIIAVFGTKHMVTLAKEAKGKIPMFSIPVKKRFMGMGTGDVAIPSVFTVSILQDFSLNHALFTIIGGLIGLLSLFFYILKREKVVLPALPPITIGLFLGFLSGYLLL